jgi:hypothetical protein
MKKFGLKNGTNPYMVRTLNALQIALKNLNQQHDDKPLSIANQVDPDVAEFDIEPELAIKAVKAVKAGPLEPRNDFSNREACAPGEQIKPKSKYARGAKKVAAKSDIDALSSQLSQLAVDSESPGKAPPAPIKQSTETELRQRIQSDLYLYQRILTRQTIELQDMLIDLQRPRDNDTQPFVVSKKQLQQYLEQTGVSFSQAWRPMNAI